MRIRAGQNPDFPQCCILAMGLNLRLSSLRPNISQPYLLCVRTASADREALSAAAAMIMFLLGFFLFIFRSFPPSQGSLLMFVVL